jgi:2-polyprenyl-6-methoxyphenol hydroxylase-like FAD-dependent oxidoreductase
MRDPYRRTSQHPVVDVLVVGAGPTGLTFACDLARRGVRTHVIEAADDLFSGSRGKGLQSRTLEAFDDLGVADAVRAAGAPFPLMQTWRNGRRQGEWRFIEPDPLAPVSRYPEQWLIPSGVRRRSCATGCSNWEERWSTALSSPPCTRPTCT